jgi:integrase
MASIRKRGGVRGEVTFQISVSMGYGADGKQQRKFTTYTPPPNVTAGKALKLAKEYATLWEENIRGYVSLDENRTMEELAEWYYSTVAPNTLKPNILIAYQQGIINHIIPSIGRVKLKDITPQMLDSLFKDLRENGNLERRFRLKDKVLFDGITKEHFWAQHGIERGSFYNVIRGKSCLHKNAEKIATGLGLPLAKVFDDVTENPGLSGASVNKIKLNLSAIFTAAVKKEIMRRNPCKLVTPQKVDTPPAAFYDEEQSLALLDAARDKGDFQLEVIVNLFLASGLWAGELTGLHWEDIDFHTGVIFAQNTLVRIKGEFVRQSTKTKGSTRRLVLPGYVLKLLQEHRARQAEYLASLGEARKRNDDIVFTNLSGDYLNASNVNRNLKGLLAGLPEIHLHSLRHTHASLLINSDVTAKVIADRLGHSTTKTTLDTYAHIFSASEVKAMQAVEMKLFQQDTDNQ